MKTEPPEAAAELEVIVAVGPKQVDLFPMEPGKESQSVQGIVFRLPRQQRVQQH